VWFSVHHSFADARRHAYQQQRTGLKGDAVKSLRQIVLRRQQTPSARLARAAAKTRKSVGRDYSESLGRDFVIKQQAAIRQPGEPP